MSDITELRIVLPEGSSGRLDKALAAHAPEGKGLSRSRIVKMLAEGLVLTSSGGMAGAKDKAVGGDEFILRIAAPVDYARAEAENIPLDVVFEDESLLVVNKPAGMVVHPAPGSETGTLVNALLHHCGASGLSVGGENRPGIVHRIDKDTSGLLVVAKTDAAHNGLAALFAEHTIERDYIGFCVGAPSRADPRLGGLQGVGFESGGVVRIATNIERHKTDRKRQAVSYNSGRHAVTRIKVEAEYGGTSPIAAKIRCRLETGRTHQIRVHASHIGHGLIGDPVYGRRRVRLTDLSEAHAGVVTEFSRQALHAARLGFVHPVSGEMVDFEVALPSDMANLEAALSSATG